MLKVAGLPAITAGRWYQCGEIFSTVGPFSSMPYLATKLADR
jgi:hypothetical protein